MTYLVMECHPGYAVVLDQTGRFLKVANLNYQVGETVSFVIECTAEEEPITIKSLRRRRMLLSAASLAACFFLAVLGLSLIHIFLSLSSQTGFLHIWLLLLAFLQFLCFCHPLIGSPVCNQIIPYQTPPCSDSVTSERSVLSQIGSALPLKIQDLVDI